MEDLKGKGPHSIMHDVPCTRFAMRARSVNPIGTTEIDTTVMIPSSSTADQGIENATHNPQTHKRPRRKVACDAPDTHDEEDVELKDAQTPTLGCKLGVYEELLAEYELGQRLQRLDPTSSMGVYVLGVARLKRGFETDPAVITSAGGAHFPSASIPTGVAFEVDGGEAVLSLLVPEETRFGALRKDDMPALTDQELYDGLVKTWDTLATLHAAGEVHGDIHANNIVRNACMGFRFIDFQGLPPPSNPAQHQLNAIQRKIQNSGRALSEDELMERAKAEDDRVRNRMMADDIAKLQGATEHLVKQMQSRHTVQFKAIDRMFVVSQPRTIEFVTNARAWLQDAHMFTRTRASEPSGCGCDAEV